MKRHYSLMLFGLLLFSGCANPAAEVIPQTQPAETDTPLTPTDRPETPPAYANCISKERKGMNTDGDDNCKSKNLTKIDRNKPVDCFDAAIGDE